MSMITKKWIINNRLTDNPYFYRTLLCTKKTTLINYVYFIKKCIFAAKFLIIKIQFMNHYETVFILNPVLSDKQIEEAVKKYVSLLESNKSKVSHKEDWGLKKLAYPIQNKNSGFYHLLQFESDAEVINSLEVEFRRDERIMRFLTVKLDIHALEWADKRKKRNLSKVKA